MTIPKFIVDHKSIGYRKQANEYLKKFNTTNQTSDLFANDPDLISLVEGDGIAFLATLIEQELQGKNRNWLVNERLYGKYADLVKETNREVLINAHLAERYDRTSN
jgi:bifunctional pyridoxal-dependent enzyme with beta-cystathionase and maltose regulon repressor activities